MSFAPCKRGDDAASCRQNQAAAHVMRLVQSLQEEALWSPPASAAAADAPSSAAANYSRSGAGAAPDGRAPSTVLLLTHQFDASKQRGQEVFASEADESASSSTHTGLVTSSVRLQGRSKLRHRTFHGHISESRSRTALSSQPCPKMCHGAVSVRLRRTAAMNPCLRRK